MVTLSKEELKNLYSKDFPLWVELNLELLRDRQFDLVDWDNLLEEIEDMGQRHLDACVSYLAVILEHLYKFDNFKGMLGDKAGESWKRSIRNSRLEIDLMFDLYPSLKAKLPLEMEKAWKIAVKNLKRWLNSNDLDYKNFEFPSVSPYSYQEAMEREV
ncbi:MAG: DUF29 domain-containing protein [Hydrogenothermaceae bacterium]